MMAKMKGLSRSYLISAFFSSTLLLLVSCGQMNAAENVTTDGPETTTIGTVSDTVLIPTYYELAQRSDIVLIGRMRSKVGVINSARNHSDNSQPDPRFSAETIVYAVEVEEYLVGEGPEIIYLAQWEGGFYNGTTPSSAEIDQVIIQSDPGGYTPLDSNKSYLMFLRSMEVWEDYDIAELENGNFFGRTADPWLFDATDPMRVFVLNMSSGIEQIYPPLPLAEIIAQMNDPTLTPPSVPNPVPYPAPLESTLEQSEPTAPSSYPAP
jgi:hypothetical protein